MSKVVVLWAFLVVQWLRICLAVQETWSSSPVPSVTQSMVTHFKHISVSTGHIPAHSQYISAINEIWTRMGG